MKDYQEIQAEEGNHRRGLRPFGDNNGYESREDDDMYIIESNPIPTEAGELFISLMKPKGKSYEEGGNGSPAITLDENGNVVEGTDKEFLKKGYSEVLFQLSNPQPIPSTVNCSVWIGDGVPLSQNAMPSEGVDDFYYVAGFGGNEDEELFLPSNPELLRKVNVSIEVRDAN